jgi:signal peptidase I
VGLESLGEANHLVQVDDMRPARDFSVVVKPGHYFMMGDNRDNSSDSRVWGQVPEKDIVGKAFAVWMHWDSLLSIPSFSRVGLIE